MADGVTDLQSLRLFLIQQDGEKIEGDHLLDDIGNAGEQPVEVERFGCNTGDVEQEV